MEKIVLEGQKAGEQTTITIRRGNEGEKTWVAEICHTWQEAGVECCIRSKVDHFNRSHLNALALNAALHAMVDTMPAPARTYMQGVISSGVMSPA